MKFHKLAELFPLLEGAEFEALVHSIEKNGLRFPIVTYHGKILDGRNRYRACNKAGKEPRFVEYTGEADGLLDFVVDANLHHRHLTREQRDEVIRKLRAEGMTLQSIADTVGVSFGTAHKAAASELIKNDKLIGADGKARPAHYETHESREFLNNPATWELGHDYSGASLPHVAHNSGENEWYTPPEYIEAAREVLGEIDLDPASSEIANRIVKAKRFYSKAEDGLAHQWRGYVFMNPPYSSELIKLFAAKFADHVKRKDITAGIVLVNNATETEWFGKLINGASAIVFPTSRVKFIDQYGKRTGAPLQGQAIIYTGKQVKKFFNAFGKFGWSAIPNKGE